MHIEVDRSEALSRKESCGSPATAGLEGAFVRSMPQVVM